MFLDDEIGFGNAANYGPGFHDASVRIEGEFARYWPAWLGVSIAAFLINDGKNAAGIKTVLESKGWIIDSVTEESGWFGNSIFRVNAVVGNIYSDATVQANMQGDLAGFFSVSGITMLTSFTPAVQAPPVVGGTVNLPPVNYGGTTPGATNPAPGAGNGNSAGFIDNLGLGLGVSTPVVIGAGALLLLLILKK